MGDHELGSLIVKKGHGQTKSYIPMTAIVVHSTMHLMYHN